MINAAEAKQRMSIESPDGRGYELVYAGMNISDIFKENIGIGGVVSLLWFRCRLPNYFPKFIEIVLQFTADVPV